MTSAPPVDTFSHVNNTTSPHDPMRHVSTCLDAPMSIEMNYNPSHGYHNVTCQTSTCFDTPQGADVYNTKDMSSRRVSPLHHPSSTSGHRTPMPTVSAPPMNATSCIHNPSPGCHDPARRKSMHLDALMGIRAYNDPSASQYGSTRCMMTCFDIISLPPPLDVSLDVDGCDYHNPLHSHHDPRRQKLTPLLGVNVHHNTKDMSLRHVSSHHHPLPHRGIEY